MAGIVLMYDTAWADSRDTGNRSMRAACRAAWNEDDYNASVARLEHLAIVFYRENYELEYGPIDLRAAFMALSETRGQPCISYGMRR